MNSFDEASSSFFFLMQSSALEGGACVCVDPVASWHCVISAALLILLKTLRVCVCIRKSAMHPCVRLN